MLGIAPKRLLLWIVIGSLFFVIFQYIPVLFYAWAFDDFVRDEVRFAPMRETTEQEHLVRHILEEARQYRLIVDEQDVHVTRTRDPARGIRVLAVDVGYRAPVDLYYFVHELRFDLRASISY